MQCIFCNLPATTEEDIFPKWLLQNKKLYNKRLNLLDGTSIPYRQLKIRICNKCNNETLSRIENKIKNGSATTLEYYIWSLKIYIGILYKESSLLSRKFGNKRTIIPKKEIVSDLIMAKNFFNVYKNKGKFYPNLPGSIIRVTRIGKNRYFDYSDILLAPILGIALPNEFVFSLPFDNERMIRDTDINKIPKDMDELTFRFLIADMGYREFRWNKGLPSLVVNNMMHISPQGFSKQVLGPFKDKEFKFFLKSVGIKGSKKNGKWEIETL